MMSATRKANTAEFTSALKQVFRIHSNIVAELCTKLDIVTNECKLLKANSHIPKSPEKCESCIHLEKMNRSLQENFNSLLHEKDIGIKALEKKLQILTDKTSMVTSQTLKGQMLPKEISYATAKQDLMVFGEKALSPKTSDPSQQACSRNDVNTAPLSAHFQEEIMNLSETQLVKGHSKLRLTRHGKRHSRYVEEQRETKRPKISPTAAAKSGSEENNLSEFDGAVLVAETIGITQQRHFTPAHKLGDNESDNEQSQQCLVVPETIDTSFNSWSEHEIEFEKHDDNENPRKEIGCAKRNCHSETAENLATKIGEHGKWSTRADNITLLNDDDMGDGNADIIYGIPGRKQAENKKQLSKEPARRISFQEQNTSEGVFQQSRYEQKVSGEETGKKRSLQNSVNVNEDRSMVNEITVINKGSSNHTDVATENNSGNISTFKPNCHSLKKHSPVLAGQAAKQKEHENIIWDSNTNSHGQDHRVGIDKENVRSSSSMRQGTLSQSFTSKHRMIDTHERRSSQRTVGLQRTEEAEKLQIAEAIQRSLKDFHNTQSSIKRSQDTSLESNFPVSGSSPQIDSVKIINVRKYNSTNEDNVLESSPELVSFKTKHMRKCISTNDSKDQATDKLVNSPNMSNLLPLPLQALDVETHESTTDTTKSTDCMEHKLNSTNTNLRVDKILNFTAPEPNGSLNPEIHLTQYLFSEVTERQNMNQMLCALDETIAPNLVSQYVATSLLSPDTSQQTVFNPETNRHIQIQQDDREPDGKIKIGLQDDDDDDDSVTVFSTDEDDLETIKPSPQQIFQGRSQLHSSIPACSSSYKFINKKAQVTSRSVLQGTGESQMINNKDSVMDESRLLLHDKSCVNLVQNTEQHMAHNSPPQELLDSFDRVPKSDDIEFPHVSVVRKKSERSKLQGFSCKQCYEYYKNSGLSEEALQQKKNDCSRHRARYQAPETPEHFWSLGFPDTAEMTERRKKYNSKESPVAASRGPRRRQRLEKKF